MHFDFSEIIYFNYRLFFFDSFDLVQFLLHLFFCPRAELVFNDCYFCSMVLIDDPEASLEFLNSTNVFYKSESKYQIIKSCEERCMKFVAIVNPIDLIISYFEVFVRFLCDFFHKLSKDCLLLSKKQAGDIDRREILLNLFISNFKKCCGEVFYQSLCYEKFEELFTILIRDVDYLSCYIKLINQNYIDFIEEKFKL